MIEIKPWQFHSEHIWLQSSEIIILIWLRCWVYKGIGLSTFWEKFLDISASIAQNHSWGSLFYWTKGALFCVVPYAPVITTVGDSAKENIENCRFVIPHVRFLHAHILYNKTEAAVRWGKIFWKENWKNFVDQAQISNVMLDLVWWDFVKFPWWGIHSNLDIIIYSFVLIGWLDFGHSSSS